jgi:hypothetical protein
VSGERICSFSVENQAPSADILNILLLTFGYRNTFHINFLWQTDYFQIKSLAMAPKQVNIAVIG